MGNISFLHQWPTARLMMLTALMAVAMPKAMAQTEQDETVVRTLSDNDQRRYRYFYLEALLQQEREHFAAAFDLFRHALEINPNAPEVHYELAGFYFMLKQPEKALACYEKAVALDPTNNNYLEYLGQMLINRKDYARAITVYERLYKGNKSRTDILQLLYQLQRQSIDRVVHLGEAGHRPYGGQGAQYLIDPAGPVILPCHGTPPAADRRRSAGSSPAERRNTPGGSGSPGRGAFWPGSGSGSRCPPP